MRGEDLERHRAKVAELREAGFEADFAERGAALLASLSLLDIVATAGTDPADVEEVARLYYAISDEIGYHHLAQRTHALPQADRRDSLGRAALRDHLPPVLIRRTRAAREATPSDDTAEQRVAAG